MLGVLALLACAPPALAGALRIELREALLELQFDAISQEVRIEGQVVNESRSQTMAPRIAVRAGAVLFDPRILTLDLGAGMRAVRGEAERLGQSDGLDEDLESYHLTAAFLGENRFSLTAMATKVAALRQLPFEVPTEIRTQTTSLNLGMRRIAYPGTLSFEKTESQQQARAGGASERDYVLRSLTYRGLRAWNLKRLDSFVRRLEFEDRRFPQSNNTTSSADIRYSADELSPTIERVTSQLLAFTRHGGFDETVLAGTGTLGLRLGPSLTSDHSLDLRFDEGSAGGGEQRTLNVSSGLRHELYESLTTRLRAAGSRLDRSDASANSWSTEADLAYDKKLPAEGRLSLRVHGGLLNREAQSTGGQLLIAGEEHLARFGAPFALDQPNVLPASILVASDSGNLFYIEHVDWIATTVGVVTEIRILTAGSIEDNQLVRVTYRIAVPGRLESTQIRTGAAFDLHFRWLDLFARHEQVEDRAIAGLPNEFIGDRVSEQIGARIRKTSGRWSGSTSGAVEREQTVVASYDQVRLTGDISAQLFHNLALNMGLEALLTEFSNPRRERELRSGILGLGWTPLSGLIIELRVEYRQFSDSMSLDERLLSEALQIRWNFRKMSVLLVATSSEIDREIALLKSARTFFSVTRRI